MKIIYIKNKKTQFFFYKIGPLTQKKKHLWHARNACEEANFPNFSVVGRNYYLTMLFFVWIN